MSKAYAKAYAKKKKETVPKKAQSPSVSQKTNDPKEARRQESTRNVRKAVTKFVSEDRRTAGQNQKMNMPTAEQQRRSQQTMKAAGKAIKSSVKESMSEESRARAQRVKSGTQTAEDQRKMKERNEHRVEVAKNTGRAAVKGAKDTVSGYGQALADIDEMVKSNKNWTAAKAQKMGIDEDDIVSRAKIEGERQQSIKEAREFRRDLARKQEKRQKEFDEQTKDATGLEKALYGAAESGTGMLIDTGIGAATGTGQFGALASMGLRTYGTTRGQAEKEGATENEDRLYSLAQAGKEVGTELMFPGAGLARKAYGKVGLDVADKAALTLTKGLTGKKADVVSAGVRLIGGTAEENAEELAGWGLDPLLKEAIYGKNVRQRMADTLKSNLPEITNKEDADRVASYFSTSQFTDDLKKEYVSSGMSQEDASKLADQMRDYYVAYYSGDEETFNDLEDKLTRELTGTGLKGSWSMDELKDTLASTTLLTMATGLPGAATTSVRGNAIFDSDEVREVFGDNAVNVVADAVKNVSDPKLSIKAEAYKKRLDEGKDLTGTQKYELYQGYLEKVRDTAKKKQASEGVIVKESRKNNYVPTVVGVTPDGQQVYAKETQMAYNEKYASTSLTTEAFSKYMESDGSISQDEADRKDAVNKAVSDLHVGGLTVGDTHEFAYGNTLAREVLKEEEGIDLNDYVVRDSNGNVDLAATNEATENALFELNAKNALAMAKTETEVYIDDTRGSIDADLLTRFGNSGQAVWKSINKNLDPRDLNTYLTHANADSYFYAAGRNTDMSVDEAVEKYGDTFKSVSNAELKRAFAAGQRDRIIANTPGYGQTVKAGSNIKLKKTEPILSGQLIMDDDVKAMIPDSTQSEYLALAEATGANIHLVSDLSPLDENGNPIINKRTKKAVQLNGMSKGNDIWLNVNTAAEQNLGYVFMHEMTHQIKQYAPNEYMALENLVRDKWFNKDYAQMQRMIKERIDLYKTKGGQSLTEEEALEEIIADAMAEAIDDPNFAAEVCETNEAVGQQILNAIKSALRSIRDMFARDEFKNENFHNALLSYLGILDDAEKMWLEALAVAKQNKANGLIADWQDRANRQSRYSMPATDSEGNELSEGQKEFFKDSKVRDDNGHLLRMYHGSESYDEEPFYVFEPNEYVEEQNGLSRIKGYFSTSEDYSNVYGKPEPYYLNIKNPLFIPDESKHLDEWKTWFAEQGVERVVFDSGIERDGLKGYGFEDGTKGYALWELFDTGDYWYGDGNLTEAIENAGYDGVYWHEGQGWNIGGGRFIDDNPLAYMPFNQNAIKRADNLNPTEDVNTRYSVSEEQREELNTDGIEELDDGTTARYSLTSWNETNKDKKLKALIDAGHSEKASAKWINDINSIASIILADQDRLDYIADRSNKFLKPNGDYYKYTLDASTLCDKRRIYQGTYDAIQHMLPDSPMMQEDVVRIRTMLKEMDHKAPCGICYVESQRKNLGDYAKQWYDTYARKDEIRLEDVTTTDGLKKLKETNPEVANDFEKAMAAKGVSSPKVVKLRTDYREDIMRMRPDTVKYLNSIGGLRFHSFSDFETPHLIDTMQAVMDMSAKGLMGMAYAKVPNFAAVFGSTGIKINLSLIAKTDENGNAVHDENGRLVFDSVEGIPFEEANKWREAYPDDVAFILVGKDKEHTLEAINDDRVDFVIPFHRSKWSAEDMRRLGLIGYEDFATGHQENGIFVSQYWDYNKTGKENAEAYLKFCAKEGVTPVFEQLLVDKGDGSYELQPDGSTDNYWKLLVEGKMYNHKTKKGAPQKIVQPNFNMEEARRVLSEYEGGANELPVAQDVVEAFVKEYVQNHPDAKVSDARLSISAKLDDDYMDAVNSGDMDNAQSLVDEAAKMAGYGVRAYHGTSNYGFTEFQDVGVANGRAFGDGFYFTDVRDASKRFALQQWKKDEASGEYVEDGTPGIYDVFLNPADDALEFDWDNYTYNGRKVEGPGLRTMIQTDIEAQPEKDVIIHNINDGSQHTSTVYVIKEAGRIKSADPVTYAEDGSVIPLSERFDPTNNDIRYSMATQDSEGRVLSDGQMEYFANSQARDEQGRLVPVYHTTNKGGFTIFDPSYSDDKRSLFFADDWDTSQTYGNYANSRFYYFDIDNIDDVKKYLDAYSPDRYFVTQEQFDQAGGWEADMLDFENVTNGEQSDFAKYLDNPDGYIAIIGVPDYSPDNTSYADTWVMAKSPDELVRELHNHFGWQRDNYRMGTQHGYYACYLNLEDPYIIDAHGDNWNEIHLDDYDDDVTFNTREIAEMAMDMDFDGVIIRNLVDHGGMSPYDGMFDYSDIYIAFSSEQVKDINNENPTENPDIRYSIPDRQEALDTMIAKADSIDIIPLRDTKLEEQRVKYSLSVKDFENMIISGWDEHYRTFGRLLDDESVKPHLISMMSQIMKDSETGRQYKAETLDETIKDMKVMYFEMKKGMSKEFADRAWAAAERIVDDIDYNDDLYVEYKGMRDYLNKRWIQIPEALMYDEDFAEYMRDNSGRMRFRENGSGVEAVYKYLRKKYPKIFTEDLDDPVDMLLQMDYVLDLTSPYRDAYTSEEYTDLVKNVAESLCEMVRQGEEYRSVADDLYEKFDARSKAMKQRHREALDKVRSEEKAKRQRQSDRANKWKEKYKQRIQHDKEVREAKKEKKMHRALYDAVLNEYNDLTKRLLKPSKDKKKNIPEQLRQPLAEMLYCFDLEKERSKELEEMYRIPTRTQLNLRQMKDSLEKVIQENETAYEFSDIHKFLKGKMTEIADKMDMLGDHSIDALDNNDIAVIKDLMVGLNSAIKNYQQFEIDGENYEAQQITDKVGEGAKEHESLYGKGKKYTGARAFVDNIVNMGELTPIYFFRQIKGMYDMYRQIRKGFDSYVRNEKVIIDKIAKILAPYYKTNRKGQQVQGSEIEDWRHLESAETFNTTYGSLTLTIAQRMSLYCLYKRDQARNHMLSDRGGVVASEITAGSKMHKAEEMLKGKVVEYKQTPLTPEDVENIIATLTPEQIKIADDLQELMSNDMSKLGNQASVKLTGIEMYKETEYFPIKIQAESKGKDLDNIGMQEKVRNPGFSNPLQENASNPIILDDIFTVVASHCNEMNLYASYAVPLTSFMKVYNGSVLGEDGKPVKVQTIIKETYGEKAIQYIDNFLDDINGNSFKRHGGLDDVLDKALGQAKKASVFANLRVALQQPTAIVRAFAVMHPKYFAGVKPSRKATQEMFEHCPIAQWKSWGYYDTHFGRDIEDVMMGANVSSKMDVIMSDIYGEFDNMTWGMIWQAVKKEVKAENPNVDEGTQEFWDLCSERASYVFDMTQVVDSPFHRSNDMRSKNGLVKQLTSFQSEPTLSFNVLRQGFVDAYEEYKKGNKAKAEKALARVLAVWTAQAVTVAIAQSFVDALRRKGADDDEDPNFFALWWQNFMADFVDDINPINNVYYFKEIVPPILNALTGQYVFGQQNLTFQWVDTLTKGIQKCKKKWEKGSAYKTSWYDCLTDLFGGVGYLAGIPVKTMMRGVKNAVHWFNKITGAEVFADDGSVDKAVDSMVDKFRKEKGDTETSDEAEETEGLSKKDAKKIFKAGIKAGEKAIPKTEEQMLKEIEEKTVGLYGEDRERKIWNIVGEGYKEYVNKGDYDYLNRLRNVIQKAGGDVNAFDKKVLDASRSAFKKSLVSDPSEAQIMQQQNIRSYLLEHGMSEEEISSELIYKSQTARDLKAAFRMGNENYIVDELVTLLRAGVTRDDIYKLYKYRNYGAKDYDGKYSSPEYTKTTGQFIWPTDGVITSHFGHRDSPTAGASSYHQAIDIGASQGTPVVAADGGVVISAGANGGYGNSVGIKHSNGMVTWYNHLYGWNVKVGDEVGQGQQIGQVGSTGISTGPHLDFKIMDADGNAVDPEQYLNKRS